MQTSDDPWRRRQVPDNEVPGCVAFEAVLASNADMVVFVSGLTVFRHGIEFTVEIRLRPGRERGENEGRAQRTVLDVVMVISVAIGATAFGIWFFFFAGSSLPT